MKPKEQIDEAPQPNGRGIFSQASSGAESLRSETSSLTRGLTPGVFAKGDKLIAGLTDWRGKTLADIRRIILAADPEIVEEWKWMGTPTWSHAGIICIANAFKDKVKVTFYDGASLADQHKLFNNGLKGNKWRTIDYFKNDKIKEKGLADLVRSAVAHNLAKKLAK